MPTEGVNLGVLGAAVGLAGLLLVFIGFLQAKSDREQLADARRHFQKVAWIGLLPFLASLACAWQSLCSLEGSRLAGTYLLLALKSVLALTGLYGIIASFYRAPEKRR